MKTVRNNVLLSCLLASVLTTGATIPVPPVAGRYRMDYSDVFYGWFSYEVQVNKASDTGSDALYKLSDFPFTECNPVRLILSNDSCTLTLPNNQHVLTDEYGQPHYLQYVDPKVVDNRDNYLVTDSAMTLQRDSQTGRISWFGGDFDPDTGWGHFLVVGAQNLGYLSFINKIDMTPLNATFCGTYTVDGKTTDYTHGCLVTADSDFLYVYGLLQLNFQTPVAFDIDKANNTAEASLQMLTDDPTLGPLYLSNTNGLRTVNANITVREDGHTLLHMEAFTANGNGSNIKVGVAKGYIDIPYNFLHTEQSGISAIANDKDTVSWYTIQGQAIATPSQPGLYIRRDSTASQIVRIH